MHGSPDRPPGWNVECDGLHGVVENSLLHEVVAQEHYVNGAFDGVEALSLLVDDQWISVEFIAKLSNLIFRTVNRAMPTNKPRDPRFVVQMAVDGAPTRQET
jgi:hypothetical protein